MQSLRKIIFVGFVSCSLFQIGMANSFTQAFYSDESYAYVSFDVSKNVGIDNVTASIYKISSSEEIYELIISGNGMMRDFSYPDLPEWNENYYDKIVYVTLEIGITSIGKNAFSALTELSEVRIENKEIQFSAVSIPEGVKIVSHMNSTSKQYAELYGMEFGIICDFSESICTKCSYECTSHTGGAATCENLAICEICKNEYGSLSEHNYSEWNTEILPSCTENGRLGYYECESCGKYFDNEENVIDSTVINSPGHLYGEWVEEIAPTCESLGAVGHYHCSVCDKNFDKSGQEILFLEISEKGHSGGNATCIQAAICEICGEIYGAKNSDNHLFLAEYKFNGQTHYYECVCGAMSGVENHSYTANVIKEATVEQEGIKEFKCVCGNIYTETIPKIEESKENLKAPTENKDYVPIILIIVTSAAILTAATILICNFVIKKKKT